MFRQIGAGEIILILAVLILLFGAKKLPELARSLGRSARELRKGMEDEEDDEDDKDDEDLDPVDDAEQAPQHD